MSRLTVFGSHKQFDQCNAPPLCTTCDVNWFSFYAYYTFKGYPTFKADTA